MRPDIKANVLVTARSIDVGTLGLMGVGALPTIPMQTESGSLELELEFGIGLFRLYF